MAKVTKEYNLKAINPALAKEWHPNKNGGLTPLVVAPSSGRKAWWLCSNGHEWLATVDKRGKGSGCPFCVNRKASLTSCLATVNPNLAKEWHPTKNGSLTPHDVTPGSEKKAWWICAKGHSWKAIIYNRVKGNGCPICSNQLVDVVNCLATINPVLAKEWHPTKNGSLTPNDVTPKSNKKVWWLCPEGHEWATRIADRGRGNACPCCSHRKASPSNCLATLNPSLAKDWHPTKNGGLTPKDFPAGSNKKVWWRCLKGHEWAATIINRATGRGCPYCSPKTSHMELRLFSEIKYVFGDVCLRKKMFGMECDIYIPSLKVAVEMDGVYWHKNKHSKDLNKNKVLEKNGISLLRVREKGLLKISKYDIVFAKDVSDIEIVKEVLGSICKITAVDPLRKALIEKYVAEGQLKNDEEFLALYSLLPTAFPGESLLDLYVAVAREWHPIKNGDLSPRDVTPGSGIKVWWLCSKGHAWKAQIASRVRGNGCPYCSNKLVNIGNCLATVKPILAKEWHPTKNESLTPAEVLPGTHKKVWWLCSSGHSWKAAVYSRVAGNRCPYCSKRQRGRLV